MNINVFFIQLKSSLWDERYKFMILLIIFVFQVLSSIISIFYMEELLALFEFDFINPIPPTGEAAFQDFFGDQFFFGIIIMTLGTMTIFASDIENGSISFSLSRPISRTHYASAKMIARISALVTPFIIASLVGWVYMGITFEIFPFERFLWALLPLGLFFIYLGVTTSALSTRTSTLTAGLVAIGIFIIQFTISAFEPLELLSPFTFSNLWVETLSNSNITQEIIAKICLLIGWILIPTGLTLFSFKTRDL
ncbi:MAG: ABC transporter permease subunit [Candidatus Heimdallarchaeota archaeon]|nr:MAG: ABC transporter permease subunit [Candidatus Heimdallarchaeota archaeon]